MTKCVQHRPQSAAPAAYGFTASLRQASLRTGCLSASVVKGGESGNACFECTFTNVSTFCAVLWSVYRGETTLHSDSCKTALTHSAHPGAAFRPPCLFWTHGHSH